MITVLLVSDWLETRPLRYDTDSFDEAAVRLVDDWFAGRIRWEAEEVQTAFSPQWLQANGYPGNNCEPQIHRETGIVTYVWHWCGEEESDDQVVYGYFIKSAPVGEDEWPTRGLPSFIDALPEEP